MVHTPREVAQAAGITFSMVSNTSALSSIANGSGSVLAGLSTGKIGVDMSTVSPRKKFYSAQEYLRNWAAPSVVLAGNV